MTIMMYIFRSRIKWNTTSLFILCGLAAAAFTALAGILHLILVQYFIGFDSNTSTFFVITGLAQIFWVLPIIIRWRRLWYIVGIAGSIALIFSWNIINAPLPVKGVAAPYDDISIIIETLQVLFIAAMMSIIIRERQNYQPQG
jgi:hypothetical protein